MRKLPVKPVAPPAYLRQAREGNVPWNEFSTGQDGDALRQMKSDSQAGLCGYCECRLADGDGTLPGGVAHLDHFYQKGRSRNARMMYDWDNLVLSCKHKDSCGKYKDCQSIESVDIINPNVEDARSMMTFVATPCRNHGVSITARGLDGPNRQRAENTIKALNLNCNRLSVMRYNRWLTFKQSAEALLDYVKTVPDNDELGQALFRHELHVLLTEMEQGEYPSAMRALAKEFFPSYVD